MIEVADDMGRWLTLPGPAQRVVCLVPSLTETIFALGCGDRLVGVTRYCVEPAGAVERIKRVGGTKNPDLDAIRALEPDLVIVNAEENRREDFAGLEDAGLNVFVSFPARARDVPGLLEGLGHLTATQHRAEALSADLRQTLAELEQASRRDQPTVFCPIWKNPWMSFNAETYADDVISLAGGINVCRNWRERYPTLSLEEIAATQPEVILLPDEPYVFQEKDLPALGPLAETPALRSGRVHFVDGKALSWFGSRTASGVRNLRQTLRQSPATRTKLS